MAAQIAGGFTLLSLPNLKGFLPAELQALKFELERLQRNTRSEVPPQDDALAQQARNQKISRLSTALQVIQHKMTSR
jgi:hypothetical protein